MAENVEKVLKFFWKIENYSYCWNKTGNCLRSPEFQMDVFEGSSWCLKLYPNGVPKYENYASVYLERLESSKGPLGITIDYEIALLRSDGTFEHVKENKNRCFRKGREFGFDNLAAREKILGTEKSVLLPEDILTVRCRIIPRETKLKNSTEIIAKTILELERYVFLWESKNNFFIRYNEFYSVPFFNNRQPLAMKLHRLSVDQIEYFYIYFSNFYAIQVLRCKIGLLDASGSISRCLVDKQTDLRRDSNNMQLVALDEILSEKSLYLPNNKLTLHCDLTFYFGVQHNHIEVVASDNNFTFEPANVQIIDVQTKNRSCSSSDDFDSLKNDFRRLYLEGTLCDISLKVGDETILAHKVVLGARSPVFKAMLTSNMKETEENTVNISDLDANNVHCMLTFMYTDMVDNLNWETAWKLYFAADKYGIMKLKSICSNVLKQNLCVPNVGKALKLANLHGDEDLRDLTLEFISRHDTEVLCSVEWKDFMTEEAYLAAESMRLVLMKKAANNSGGKKRN